MEIPRELNEVTTWFIAAKMPDVKDKIQAIIKKLENSEVLEDIENKLLGFMLFSYSMNHGPASFIGIQILAESIGAEKEVEFYAKDWIGYSKSKTTQP